MPSGYDPGMGQKGKKSRLDQFLVQYHSMSSVQAAQAMIMARQVKVNDQFIDKAGHLVSVSDHIEIKEQSLFVSRGGLKLQSAYKHRAFPIKDKLCVDIGISTGGFTDFLLQHQARHVLGVDVSYGLTAYSIRSNPNVTLVERTNARYLTPELLSDHLAKVPATINDISTVVMDASFISCIPLLTPLYQCLAPATTVVCLIKPQFESKKTEIEPGGLITDPVVYQTIIERTTTQIKEIGFEVIDSAPCGIKGPKGNQERFIWLKRP